MRRQDREANMRGKSQERQRSGRDEYSESQSDRTEQEQMKGGSTSSQPQKPSSERQSGRLPLPD
jgi:hypothetical protein